MTNFAGRDKLKSTLADVLAIHPTRRREHLDAASLAAEDRAEIESLLGVESEAADFLSVPATGLMSDIFSTKGEGHSPTQIGPYKIVGELGSGGMGAVFLGERSDGKFKQLVAIKMLRREFNTRAVRERFTHEKEILAALSHPYIASLLDADVTAEGVPFLVMEYVEGLPLDQFCEEHGLDLNARLKLFNKVCEAVAFAHRNLVVHRDVKPSNILVTQKGDPKLLDFGISKILNEEIQSADRSITLLGALTPAYASPEQIEGRSVTTATDIYSLGIVLFKILTGRLPFESGVTPNAEMLKRTREAGPALPSIAARQNSDSAVSGAELRGDLDNIVLKSIARRPEKRYQTVEQLSADIWRYIDGEAIQARPATMRYRARKFIKRNRIAVAAAALVLISLVTGTAVASWQASVARTQAAAATESHRQASSEAENARAEKEKAEKLGRFLMKIISYANPHWHAEGHRFNGDARVLEALLDMGSKIDSEFADQPEVLAELHHHFADAYLYRNEPELQEKAKAHAARALELRRSHHGEWHELVAKDMAYVYWVQDTPRPDWAIRMLSEAIVMMRSTNSKNRNLPYMLEDYFHRLGDDRYAVSSDKFLSHAPTSTRSDKYLAAEELYDEMLRLLPHHFNAESEQVVMQKCSGIELKLRLNRSREAQELYESCKQQLSLFTEPKRRASILEDLRAFESQRLVE